MAQANGPRRPRPLERTGRSAASLRLSPHRLLGPMRRPQRPEALIPHWGCQGRCGGRPSAHNYTTLQPTPRPAQEDGPRWHKRTPGALISCGLVAKAARARQRIGHPGLESHRPSSRGKSRQPGPLTFVTDLPLDRTLALSRCAVSVQRLLRCLQQSTAAALPPQSATDPPSPLPAPPTLSRIAVKHCRAEPAAV